MPEIFVHSFRFAENTHFVAEAPRCLSAEELARAARFKVETARQEFLVSHFLLRQTLSRHLQNDACSIRYRYGEHGKPLLDLSNPQNLNFSLSHSGDRLLIAVLRGAEVGVDIERIQQRSNPIQLANHFMSRDETLQLVQLTDPMAQREFFFALWTRKEAFIKALGKGFFHPLNKTGMQEIAAGIHRPRSEDHRDYRVIDLEIAADYKAAVAAHVAGGKLAEEIGIKVLED